MPGLARLGLHHDFAAIVADHAYSAGGHAQYHRLNVSGQQQVAATADHQQGHLVFPRIGQGLTHIGVAMGLGKKTGLDIHSKAVERLERNLGSQLQTHNRSFSSITSRSLARSIKYSTCSKPCSLSLYGSGTSSTCDG